MITINVKYKVTVWGQTYYPWEQTIWDKEAKEVLKAPYVTKVATKEVKEVVKPTQTANTWAEANDNAWDDTNVADGDENDDNGDDVADLEQVEFTEEELRALPEEDLRKIYAEVQNAAGKTAPTNIKVDTIIANLLK